MTIELRSARADEMGQLGLLAAYVYGGSYGDGEQNLSSTANKPEWTLCAFDGQQMASMFCTIPFTMRAAGRALPMGGITSVGTLPEFRRRGLMGSLMRQSLADMAERGQSVASLWASQAAIYQRYQFAMTSILRQYTIDTADLRYHSTDNYTAHRVTQEKADTAFDDLKSLYIEFVADRMFYLHRSRALWHNNMLEEISDDGPVRIAVSRDADGRPTGYVIYTLRSGKVSHESRSQELKVREILWQSIDAYRSLWDFLGAHDLVGRIRWDSAPADDPLPELLAEPRLLHARDHEGAWFRIVDVKKALVGRGYVDDGEISIAVADDPLTPWNDGTYRLTVENGIADVSKTNGSSDLQVSIKALASLYTGFRTANELASWGMVRGQVDAIARAGRLFGVAHAPHCPDHF